jgi:glycerol-3-phosphate dehydrogenase
MGTGKTGIENFSTGDTSPSRKMVIGGVEYLMNHESGTSGTFHKASK